MPSRKQKSCLLASALFALTSAAFMGLRLSSTSTAGEPGSQDRPASPRSHRPKDITAAIKGRAENSSGQEGATFADLRATLNLPGMPGTLSDSEFANVLGDSNLLPPAPPEPEPEHHTRRLLVRFKPGTQRQGQRAAHSVVAGTVLREYRLVTDLQLVELPVGIDLPTALEAYRNNPNVLYAEPDYVVHTSDIPDDPDLDLLWGLHNTGQTIEGPSFLYPGPDPGTAGADIRAVEAWDIWTGDPDFRIAVIDTGVNYLHPDLRDNIWTNPNEEDGDADGETRSDGSPCPGLCGVDDDGDNLIDEDCMGRMPYLTDDGQETHIPPGEPENPNGSLNEAYWDPQDCSGQPANDDDENGWPDDIHGYDTLNEDGDPMDDMFLFHGSHVAGTIGAVGNNDRGVVGVNWQCKIVGLKFLDNGGSGYTSDAVEAMHYVIDNGIKVSNHSWGGPQYSQAMYDIIQAAQASGHIFVAAAGNAETGGTDNDILPHYPSAYDLPNIIAVAATDNDDNLAHFSMYGPASVDLGAPGVKIYSTVSGSDYAFLDGTSMATPHVTGVVALLMSRLPELGWQEVRERIFATVRPVASLAGMTVTGGVVNAAAAIGNCNGNGIPDEQDIADGTSEDCNENALPDECERGGSQDCEGNGLTDLCDVYLGGVDCNDNHIPDDCEPDEDCDENGNRDICDLAAGIGQDLNNNGLMDDCEDRNRVVYVDSVSDPLEDGSFNHPYDSIQEAIDVSISENTVIVAQGIYTGVGNRNLDFGGRDITLRSTNPSDQTVVAGTIVDCQAAGRGFYFHNGETQAAVLEGLTIRNGSAGNSGTPGYARGGGIYCKDSNPTIRHCIIADNAVDSTIFYWFGGGGIYLDRSSPRIDHCTITGNVAGNHGGGIYCRFISHPDISNCTITDNWTLVGGGIACISSDPTIRNCRIANNPSVYAGGISCQNGLLGFDWFGANPTIDNCTIAGNWAERWTGGIASHQGSHALLRSCIVWDNSTREGGYGQQLSVGFGSTLSVSFSDVQGGREAAYLSEENSLLWDDGNIDASPMFEDADLHLPADSPCVNAGDLVFVPQANETDIDGQDRLQRCRVDMGADESPFYVDCNENGLSDACEVLDGIVDDVNGNGVPDACEACVDHADCDDERFCNGFEACQDGFCVAGVNPCPIQLCDEEDERCVDCLTDADCDDDDPCTGDVCLADGQCAPSEDVCLATFSLKAAEVNGVPLEGEPLSSVTVYSGDTVTCEIFVEGWAPHLLRVYQAVIDSSGYTTGLSGSLAPLVDPDPSAGAYIDELREDYVFVGLPTLGGFSTAFDSYSYAFGILSAADAVPDPGAQRYCGTLILNVSQDAAGIFRLGFVGEWRSTLSNSANRSILPLVLEPLTIGVIPDCNDNGVPDDQDIANGTSQDCNGNTVPDECEPDCNRNGIADSCDIADGTSQDDNGNGNPDECEPPVLYVDADATGLNSGINWGDAFNDLQDALTVAAGSLGAVSEIWVAAGTYRPSLQTSPVDLRTATFQLINGVAIFGGCAGWETSLTDRDPAANLTTLSGDLGSPDDDSDNSYHVITGSGTDATAILDHFTITAGQTSTRQDNGGGMLNFQGSPTVANCTFRFNNADMGGGGMYNHESSPTVINCIFSDNSANIGGAMANSSSSPTLINCTFSNNSSHSGGGVFGAHETFINCTFSGNYASRAGGAYSGRVATFANCTFADNAAYDHGGAIAAGVGHVQIENCVLWGNSAPLGPELSMALPSPTELTVAYSNIEGGAASIYVTEYSVINWGDGNLNADPLFIDPDYGNYHLSPDSPCVDSGNNAAIPVDMADLDDDGDRAEPTPQDLDGNPRITDGTVDRGAYEQPDCNGNGISDWQEMAAGTQEDCNGNHVPDECDLAEGSSEDCNHNAAPDECDIAGNTSEDCDGNGIPNECEDTSADCNNNGVWDACDIATGSADDCNSNGIPDECEEDCNGNTVPDDCDIAGGTSDDCNGNEIPDDCDIAEGTSEDHIFFGGDGIPDECQINRGLWRRPEIR